MSNQRNVNLATTTSITTTYAGEFAGEYIAAALLSASTIDDGGLTVKANIAFKEVIKKLATNALVTAAGCDFSPTSTITLTERIIEPVELQVNLQLCKYDFVNDWEAQSMGYGLGQTLPPKFSDFLIAHVASEVAQNTEFCIWQGDTTAGTNNSFDGFEKLIAASATAGDIPAGQQVAAIAGGLLSTNIIDELSKVVDAIPGALYGKEDLFLYVGTQAAKLYVQALGGFGANGLGANGVNAQGTQWYANGNGLSFDGINVVMCPGMPATKAVIAEKSNLFFGTSIVDEANGSVVKLLDMSDLDGSQNCRVIVRFFAGAQIGVPQDALVATLG